MFTTHTHAKQKNKLYIKPALALSLSVLLSACGGGSESPSADSVSNTPVNGETDAVDVNASMKETLISGSAIKGAISNGIVQAYLIENVAGSFQPSLTPIGSSVRTDAQGNYNLNFSGNFEDESILVEITADSLTRMMCDATAGCSVAGSQDIVDFGDTFALPSSFSMKSVATGLDAGQDFSIAISPLTSLAVASIEEETQGFSEQNITTAYSQVEETFGLESGALRLAPADITRLEAYDSLTETELAMGVISASFLSLVDGNNFDDIVDVMLDVEGTFSSDQGMASVSSEGDNSVALDQVFLAANEIASDLLEALPDSTHATRVNSVATSTSNSYQAIVEQNNSASLALITSHPQSIALEEGESLTLSVSASGDALVYQWRKDGVAISGATSGSLSLPSAETDDSGEYDVVITNAAGSVTSLAALVSVTASEIIVDNGGNGSGSSGDDNNDGTVGDGDNDSPIIISPVQIVSSPDGLSVTEGDEAVFSVAVSGNGTVTYQWRKDGQVIAGATSNSLSFSSVAIADAGSYDVLVTNEAGAVASTAASLQVAALERSIMLSWSIPLAREDGTDLELYEIEGYTISYGTDENNLDQSINIEGGNDTEVEVSELSSGTYYFQIATIDSDGAQGEFTETISVSI